MGRGAGDGGPGEAPLLAVTASGLRASRPMAQRERERAASLQPMRQLKVKHQHVGTELERSRRMQRALGVCIMFKLGWMQSFGKLGKHCRWDAHAHARAREPPLAGRLRRERPPGSGGGPLPTLGPTRRVGAPRPPEAPPHWRHSGDHVPVRAQQGLGSSGVSRCRHLTCRGSSPRHAPNEPVLAALAYIGDRLCGQRVVLETPGGTWRPVREVPTQIAMQRGDSARRPPLAAGPFTLGGLLATPICDVRPLGCALPPPQRRIGTLTRSPPPTLVEEDAAGLAVGVSGGPASSGPQ